MVRDVLREGVPGNEFASWKAEVLAAGRPPRPTRRLADWPYPQTAGLHQGDVDTRPDHEETIDLIKATAAGRREGRLTANLLGAQVGDSWSCRRL